MHQILFCALRMDEEGTFAAPCKDVIGGAGQVYPDALDKVNRYMMT